MAQKDAKGWSFRFTAFPFQPDGRYVCGCLDVCAAMSGVILFSGVFALVGLKLLSAGLFAEMFLPMRIAWNCLFCRSIGNRFCRGFGVLF